MNERVALVTGGTCGIGAAISTHLARHGARIAAVYNRDAEAARSFAGEAGSQGLPVSIHQANVADFADCKRVVSEILRQYGQIDYLVNNAGTGSGQFFMSQAVLGHLIERNFGRIVMVSSHAGQASYAAAKSGLFGLTKTLALETAAKGITVNCVVLGATRALGTPDDVAEAVRYLVSDQAHYLTGALLPVAGGLLIM